MAQHLSPDRFLVTYHIQDGENEYREAFLFRTDDLETILRFVCTREMEGLDFATPQAKQEFLEAIRTGEPMEVDGGCRAYFDFVTTEVPARHAAVLRRYLAL